MIKKYLSLTFLLNYSLGAIYVSLFYFTGFFQDNRFLQVPFQLLYMIIPALIAIVLIKKNGKTLREYGFSFRFNKHWLSAWFLPYVISIGTILVCVLLGWGIFDSDFSEYIAELAAQLPAEEIQKAKDQIVGLSTPFQYLLFFIQTLVAGSTINALAAFGEEMGWRGLLFTEMKSMGFWKSNIIIGVIWGVWHAPIIATGYNFPNHPFVGIAMMSLACIPLAIVVGYIRERTGSVIAASIFHGTFNAVAGLPLMFISGAEPIFKSPVGLAGFFIASIISIIIFFFLNPEKASRLKMPQTSV